MPTIKRFEEIHAWQAARSLTRDIYDRTRSGDFSRDFGLRDQVRRSAVSIMDNIAEGFESRTLVQFVHYLGQAKASSGELRSQLYVALDAGYLTQPEFDDLYNRVVACSRQIAGFMTYLERQTSADRVKDGTSLYSVDEPI